MRVSIIAVGRLKDDAEREIVSRYLTRFAQSGRTLGLSSGDTVELPESRASTDGLRRADEALRLERAMATADVRVMLDVEGRPMPSPAFAETIAAERDSGRKHMAIVIGGPDGMTRELLSTASYRLSLGPMTLPHGLARVVMAEQLYRAATILAGHPYHRA
ncbi:MAG: 23S rRNA (pseudouridine(1915)-N(3))-methyltransferase RlmH [Hyphomicrobium sp.]|nr:23S rRNA (pseudouridine(1915)-N(3))-methyltransferase RlmH [Hyphomicrobium sp.]